MRGTDAACQLGITSKQAILEAACPITVTANCRTARCCCCLSSPCCSTAIPICWPSCYMTKGWRGAAETQQSNAPFARGCQTESGARGQRVKRVRVQVCKRQLEQRQAGGRGQAGATAVGTHQAGGLVERGRI